MAEHKLPSGKALIEGIVKLGQVLGYYVEKEFPIDEPTYGESPAVDVAWFFKKGNRFPLFIFEVESKATNGMTNNPLKVYAQENREFEKPLFFFHVVAQGGSHSSRPRNLESQYGKNNYRIYLVGNDSATFLISDVMSQHVRVRDDMDYVSLHELLCSDLWKDKADHVALLKHAASLELSKELIISSYIHLSRNDNSLLKDLLCFIQSESERKFINIHINTYLGWHWFVPIMCSMIIGQADEPDSVRSWSSKLLEWQNNSSYMPMITPSFGLERDYDEFILGCAPQLITLCIAVSDGKGEFYPTFVAVIEETINQIGVCWAGLNPAIYLLHISACLDLTKSYENARSYLHEFGTLAESNIYTPPSFVSVMDGEFLDYFQSGEGLKIPSMAEFSKVCQKMYEKEQYDFVALSLRALDDDSYIYGWSNDILSAIWSKNRWTKHCNG
jgi:hypothetical protein